MAQTSRFWDGTVLGDATSAPYDASNEFAAVMRSVSGAGGIATNQGGVFRGELNELAVTGAATPVSINTGRAINQGTWYEQDASSTIAVASPSVSTRIDVIVLRKDWSAQTVRLVKILGTEGGAAPALVQIAGTTWDIPLANVSITTGGVITLTDRRQFLGDNYFANISSFAIGDLLYAGSSSALAKLPDVATGSVLVSGGVGAAPTWSATPTVTALTTTGNVVIGGVASAALGAVGTPSYSFTGDLNTGFWSPTADTIAASTGGTERWRIDSAGLITITNRIRSSSSGAANAVIYAVGNDSGLGMYAVTSGQIGFATNDTLQAIISSPGILSLKAGTSDGVDYTRLLMTGGGNNIASSLRTYTEINITSGSAKKIAGLDGGGGVYVVHYADGVGNRSTDLVLCSDQNATKVAAAFGGGTPNILTYSISGGNLFAQSSGITVKTHCIGLTLAER